IRAEDCFHHHAVGKVVAQPLEVQWIGLAVWANRSDHAFGLRIDCRGALVFLVVAHTGCSLSCASSLWRGQNFSPSSAMYKTRSLGVSEKCTVLVFPFRGIDLHAGERFDVDRFLRDVLALTLVHTGPPFAVAWWRISISTPQCFNNKIAKSIACAFGNAIHAVALPKSILTSSSF